MADKQLEIKTKDLMMHLRLRDLIRSKEQELVQLQKEIAKLTQEVEQHRREGWPDNNFNDDNGLPGEDLEIMVKPVTEDTEDASADPIAGENKV